MLLVGLPPANEMEILGKAMRDFALLNKCLRPEDGLNPYFHHFIGEKYEVALTLECFKDPPEWHCSVAILHDIGHGTDKTFGLPDQAMLRPSLWPEDDRKNARDIMGYVLGPAILDEDQRILEIPGMFVYHWLTEALPQTLRLQMEN